MARDKKQRNGEGKDEKSGPGEDRQADAGSLDQAASTPRSSARSAKNSSRPKPEAQVNAIQATRRPRKAPLATEARAASSEAREASTGDGVGSRSTQGPPRGDSDPWTVPQSVRDRFVQDGHRFYFPDGAPAFKDQGRKLTTPSENTQVVRSLIEIAHSRGWTEVSVTGTDRFRQEVWRQARMEGLGVRGHRPSDAEQAQLVRSLARNLSRPTERVDSISVDPVPVTPSRPGPAEPAPARTQETYERIAGKLLDHGRDAYRHDPEQDPSYFVRLKTGEGTREIWGRDIERAIARSLSRPEIGDEVVLQRTGRDAVTVKRQERSEDGAIRAKDVSVFRNRWVIEKEEFFEERTKAALLVRNPSIDAKSAVREHPELAGTYLNLRAAELASQGLRDPQDRRRFLEQVRAALAEGIERGDPLQPVRLRDRAAVTAARSEREDRAADRAQAR